MAKLADSIPVWARRLVTSPRGELTRWQRAVRDAIDLAWHCARSLSHDKAGQMAAALTYRTIFSLVPMVVLSLVGFSVFADFEKMRPDIQTKVLQFAGFDVIGYERMETEEEAPLPDSEAPAESESAPGEQGEKPKIILKSEDGGVAVAREEPESPAPELRDAVPEPDPADDNAAIPPADTPQQKEAQANLLIKYINGVIDSVAKLDYRSLGIVGFVILIWAALGLVISLEDAFNQVFGAASGRSWTRRIFVYWSALTLGPILLALSSYLAGRFLGFVEEQQWTGMTTLVEITKRSSALFVSWLLLLFLYRLMPNTQVNLRPAAIGALVAAILWECGKYAFALYVRTALPYSALYGSLGLIPLFLFWVYVTWLIVLFGLELTYTLQHLRAGQFKHEKPKQADEQVVDAAWLVPLAARVAESFRAGRAARIDELAQEMNLSPRPLMRMLAALEQAGIVHRVVRGAEQEGVSLARPADQIPIAQVIDAAQALLPRPPAAANGRAAWRLVDDLHKNRTLLEGKTLADVSRAEAPSGFQSADRAASNS